MGASAAAAPSPLTPSGDAGECMLKGVCESSPCLPSVATPPEATDARGEASNPGGGGGCGLAITPTRTSDVHALLQPKPFVGVDASRS